MSEITQEETLRQAVAPVGQTLKETEARCTVLGQLQQTHVQAERRSSGR